MKIPVQIHQPFGPFILESYLPDEIVDELNRKTEEICNDPEEMDRYCSSAGNIPNLLLRDFEVVYFTEKYLEDIGFRSFAEKLGNYYVERAMTNNVGYDTVKLSIIDGGKDRDPSFTHSEDIRYSDAWVNRYYSGDFTPLHDHGSDLAGVVILKIPDGLIEEQIKNRESDGESYKSGSRSNGRIQFLYGGGNLFSHDEYTPSQEVGKVLLFPAWLGHLVYPMRGDYERRTMSFNLISEKEYFEREALG